MATEPIDTDDIIDIREVIARFEELDEQDSRDEDEQEERDDLAALLADCKDMGGDEQWRGDWYPGTLIRDNYFQEYARELAEDIGAIDRNASWPLQYIDWEEAAKALQMDYSSVEYAGVEYWTR